MNRDKPYNSATDTMEHKLYVKKLFEELVIPELKKRAIMHDASKLKSPEKECYDKYIPLLKDAPYWSEEYQEIKDEMRTEGLSHHFKENSHHPEHYEHGIYDMDLFDVIEMFTDWVAASLKSDTKFTQGIQVNREKYDVSPQLYSIFLNTWSRYYKKIAKDLQDNRD